MFFVFFFFKQKTAYEMRISDWSSDVCSSDLQDAEAGIAADLLQQFVRRPPGVRQFPEMVRRLVQDAGQEHIAGADLLGQLRALLVGQQIGRASCRERVCQYV